LPLHIIFVHIIFTSVVIEPTQTWQKPWKRNHAPTTDMAYTRGEKEETQTSPPI